MGLFDKHYHEINAFVSRMQAEGKVIKSRHHDQVKWPTAPHGNLVLSQDAAVELGNPRDVSTSFLLWHNDVTGHDHGRITLVGPDLPRLINKQASFGKIVIVGGEDFDEDNGYTRYREMERVRYDIHLRGYMMRGVSQYQREWSRISREAIENGLSFKVLGSALIEKMSQFAYVRTVEVIFITSSREDVIAMKSVGDSAMRITGAMNKMASELSLDCDTCEYVDVCDDVAELRSMHKALANREAAVHG